MTTSTKTVRVNVRRSVNDVEVGNVLTGIESMNLTEGQQGMGASVNWIATFPDGSVHLDLTMPSGFAFKVLLPGTTNVMRFENVPAWF